MYGVEDPAAVGGGVCGNDHRGFLQRWRRPVEIADRPAGFAQDQGCGGIIPWHKPHLEIQFRLPCRQQAQLDRGAPGAAEIVAVHVDVVDDVAAGLCELLPVGGHGRE